MTAPSAHIQSAAAVTRADDDWKDWSAAWTRQAKRHTSHTDLTVVVAPGAGGGAPACFIPAQRRIEVDARHIGSPDVADPRRAAHKTAVPAAFGLFVHECAHSEHSGWDIPDGTPPVVADVAMMLEESRMEGRQRARRRGDRRWLRAAVSGLILADDAPVDDAWSASRVAGLLLARVDARIITGREARTAKSAVTAVLGRKKLQRLRDIWREAHTAADDDAITMIDLAWRWCRAIGINPRSHPEIPEPDLGGFAGLLAAALIDFLAAQAGLTPGEYRAAVSAARYPVPAAWTPRDPTTDERKAARHLAGRLAHARTQHPEPAGTQSQVPPGRLRVRHAITAQAQKAAGAIPTAAPWERRASTPPHKPTLCLGVLVDVSGSMKEYMKPLSSAAWILAHGARRNQAVTTTIAFGSSATLLVPPGTSPGHVHEMHANQFNFNHACSDAIKLADRLLGLRHGRYLRLLAIVSDGELDDVDAVQKLITTLHRSSCRVLWITPDDGVERPAFADTTTLIVSDPVEAVRHIADAAVQALANA